MSKRYFAQGLNEISIISSIVFGICAISVFTFGDQLANILGHNPVIAMFSQNRTESVAEKNALLTNVKVNSSGSTFSAPLENVIRTRLANGTIQTSGSSGNIDETVAVIQGYVSQLNSLVNTLPASDKKTAVLAAIQKYNEAITKYKSMDQQAANTLNNNLVKQLNITTDLEVSGTNAKTLDDTVTDLLNSTTLSEDQYKLLDVYRNGLLSLGGSLEYSIDSRYLSSRDINNLSATAKATANMIESSINFIRNSTSLNLASNVLLKNLLYQVDNCTGLKSLNFTKLKSALTALETDMIKVNASTSSSNLSTIISRMKVDETKLSFNSNVTTIPNISLEIVPYVSSSSSTSSTTINPISPSSTSTSITSISSSTSISISSSSTLSHVIEADTTTTDEIGNHLVLKVGTTTLNYTDTSCLSSSQISTIKTVTGLASTANLNDYYVYKLPTTAAGNTTYYLVKKTSVNIPTTGGTSDWSNAELNQSISIKTSAYNKASYEITRKYTNTQLDAISNLLPDCHELLNINNSALSVLKNTVLASTTDMTNTISVYRDGNYKEIIPDSFNTAALCNTLDITPVNNTCNLN